PTRPGCAGGGGSPAGGDPPAGGASPADAGPLRAPLSPSSPPPGPRGRRRRAPPGRVASSCCPRRTVRRPACSRLRRHPAGVCLRELVRPAAEVRVVVHQRPDAGDELNQVAQAEAVAAVPQVYFEPVGEVVARYGVGPWRAGKA